MQRSKGKRAKEQRRSPHEREKEVNSSDNNTKAEIADAIVRTAPVATRRTTIDCNVVPRATPQSLFGSIRLISSAILNKT